METAAAETTRARERATLHGRRGALSQYVNRCTDELQSQRRALRAAGRLDDELDEFAAKCVDDAKLIATSTGIPQAERFRLCSLSFANASKALSDD